MIDYKNIIKDRELRLRIINKLAFIPTRSYLKMVYLIKTGRKLNLNNPDGFNEKLNWLKIHDIHPEYSPLVDKVGVRQHISDTIGSKYLFPLLGTWDHFDDIDFSTLPNQFVLKCNHDSGSVKIIDDKSKIDKKALRKFFEGRLRINPYVIGREYPYKNVRPCILAEKFMKSADGGSIDDYKFFCFSGKPLIMYIATNRATNVKFDFFDMDFNHLDIVNIHPNTDSIIQKPDSFDEMKSIASKLSQGMKFVRIDLYDINSHIYFSEYTFFHAGGFYPFFPESWEKKLGDMIILK